MKVKVYGICRLLLTSIFLPSPTSVPALLDWHPLARALSRSISGWLSVESLSRSWTDCCRYPDGLGEGEEDTLVSMRREFELRAGWRGKESDAPPHTAAHREMKEDSELTGDPGYVAKNKR